MRCLLSTSAFHRFDKTWISNLWQNCILQNHFRSFQLSNHCKLFSSSHWLCYLWSALMIWADVGFQTMVSYTWRLFQYIWNTFKTHSDWFRPHKYPGEEIFHSAAKLHMCFRFLLCIPFDVPNSTSTAVIYKRIKEDLKLLKLFCHLVATSVPLNNLVWQFEQNIY